MTKSTEICTPFFRLTLVNLMQSINYIFHSSAVIDESEEMIIAVNFPIEAIGKKPGKIKVNLNAYLIFILAI